jgi:Flp pilus assembly protein CpaB
VIAYLPGSAAPGLAGLAAQNPALTRSLIEDFSVLAVDREAQAEQGRPKSSSVLTLEIKAADLERFEHARQTGSISLALRADGDKTPLDSKGQTSASLWSNASKLKPVFNPSPAAPQRPTMTQQAPHDPGTSSEPLQCVSLIEGLKLSKECLP